MTPQSLWSVATDRVVRVRPGPTAWHRCGTCKTRWRAVGRYVRRTHAGYGCPGCRLRHKEAK